jgi:hypothetical protein
MTFNRAIHLMTYYLLPSWGTWHSHTHTTVTTTTTTTGSEDGDNTTPTASLISLISLISLKDSSSSSLEDGCLISKNCADTKAKVHSPDHDHDISRCSHCRSPKVVVIVVDATSLSSASGGTTTPPLPLAAYNNNNNDSGVTLSERFFAARLELDHLSRQSFAKQQAIADAANADLF